MSSTHACEDLSFAYADSFSYETVRRPLIKHSETVAGPGMVHPRGQR